MSSGADEAPAVLVRGLVKRFAGMERPALDSLSCRIRYGGMTGLVGPDGAGKTTFIRLLVGLLRPDAGSAHVCGHDASTEAERIHPVIGYMPQKFGLYEDLSVLENLRLYADLRGVIGAERREKFASLLAFTDLERFGARLAGKLSGGMKQKLGLACALLGQPRVLLLDEPSVGVDPISRRELWRMVRELLSGGMAVLWSTSYLDEAERCESVLLLNEGKLLHDGPPEDLLRAVQGRVWELDGLAGEARRAGLMALIAGKGVTDAVIQGRAIRIVAKTRAEEGAARPVKLEVGLDVGLDVGLEAGLRAGPPAGPASGPVHGLAGADAAWRPARPRFEDAFIDLLGGGPSGLSVLGEAIAEKKDTGQAVIDARGLTKRFGDFTAVRDNSFQIGRGEIFGLLGPNGAGKSTTFKMLCGLLQPTEGTARVMGIDLKRSSSVARQRIGYMAQKFSLYGSISLLQNLRFFAGVYGAGVHGSGTHGAGIRGLSGRAGKDRIAMMISLFGFAPYLDMSAETLPLGFKQRLALACAVMHEPDVLFLDEPTSGVDPVTRREFWLHINGMVQKGVTVMVTTHFMDEAEYCDRIALIYRGDNIATGTPDALKEMARSDALPDPSLEDAFIALVRRSEAARAGREEA